MLKAIIIFSVMSLLNVMLNTFKTIIMYKQNKFSSSLINAITYGVYCFIIVLMAGEMDLWLKISLTAITNFIGVWLSMIILEKLRKDKLWKVEATVKTIDKSFMVNYLCADLLPYNVVDVENGQYSIFNIYCKTQKESLKAKAILAHFNAKYFVSESLSL